MPDRHLASKVKRRYVIVLDNIGKLSPHKLALIRYLTWEKRFLFIAIAESFLPEDDLFRLHACLYPSKLICLQSLSLKHATEFFRSFSSKYHFFWTQNHIRMLATATGGYPFGMRDFVTRELERRKGG